MINAQSAKQLILYTLEHVFYVLLNSQDADHALMELQQPKQNVHRAMPMDSITLVLQL